MYAELIVAAFIHDSLYGMNGVSGISGYTYLLAAIVATGLSALLKVVIKR